MVTDFAPDSDPSAEGDPGRAARLLIRAARSASLATLDEEGAPYVALVTPATAPDLSVILLLSRLARHTRALAAEPRCALLFVGESSDPNPQTLPRVSLTGRAERLDAAAAAPLEARFLALHPYAELYAGFGDFAVWRITPETLHYVGGFARAYRLPPRKFALPAATVAALAAAEPALLAALNARSDALAALCGAPAEAVALDADGLDLRLPGPRTRRFAWPHPVERPEDVERAFTALCTASSTAPDGTPAPGRPGEPLPPLRERPP